MLHGICVLDPALLVLNGFDDSREPQNSTRIDSAYAQVVLQWFSSQAPVVRCSCLPLRHSCHLTTSLLHFMHMPRWCPNCLQFARFEILSCTCPSVSQFFAISLYIISLTTLVAHWQGCLVSLASFRCLFRLVLLHLIICFCCL